MASVSVPGPSGTTLNLNLPDGTPQVAIDSILSGLGTLQLIFGTSAEIAQIDIINGAPGTGAAHHANAPVAGDVNIYNFTPDQGGTYTLTPKGQGIILSGSTDAKIIGHAAGFGSELLAANSGADTLRGGGASGTLVGGMGGDHFATGTGNVLVESFGNDTIHTGIGNDTVNVLGSATVYAGGGITTFNDNGTGSSSVTASTGTTFMNNVGGGNDTFVGGSGLTVMTDEGLGSTTFDITKAGLGGTDIIRGFDPTRDKIALNGYTPTRIDRHATVVGGSTYVSLGDGTKIVLIGFTGLNASNFTG